MRTYTSRMQLYSSWPAVRLARARKGGGAKQSEAVPHPCPEYRSGRSAVVMHELNHLLEQNYTSPSSWYTGDVAASPSFSAALSICMVLQPLHSRTEPHRTQPRRHASQTGCWNRTPSQDLGNGPDPEGPHATAGRRSQIAMSLLKLFRAIYY